MDAFPSNAEAGVRHRTLSAAVDGNASIGDELPDCRGWNRDGYNFSGSSNRTAESKKQSDQFCHKDLKYVSGS